MKGKLSIQNQGTSFYFNINFVQYGFEGDDARKSAQFVQSIFNDDAFALRSAIQNVEINPFRIENRAENKNFADAINYAGLNLFIKAFNSYTDYYLNGKNTGMRMITTNQKITFESIKADLVFGILPAGAVPDQAMLISDYISQKDAVNIMRTNKSSLNTYDSFWPKYEAGYQSYSLSPLKPTIKIEEMEEGIFKVLEIEPKPINQVAKHAAQYNAAMSVADLLLEGINFYNDNSNSNYMSLMTSLVNVGVVFKYLHPAFALIVPIKLGINIYYGTQNIEDYSYIVTQNSWKPKHC